MEVTQAGARIYPKTKTAQHGRRSYLLCIVIPLGSRIAGSHPRYLTKLRCLRQAANRLHSRIARGQSAYVAKLRYRSPAANSYIGSAYVRVSICSFQVSRQDPGQGFKLQFPSFKFHTKIQGRGSSCNFQVSSFKLRSRSVRVSSCHPSLMDFRSLSYRNQCEGRGWQSPDQDLK